MATDHQIIKAQIKNRKISTYLNADTTNMPLVSHWSDTKTTAKWATPKITIDEQKLRERLWTELDNRYGDIDQDWFDKLINKVKEN